MPSNAVILEMRTITKEFPGVKALEDVSLTVHANEIHAICGENGAGKSTLMKVLSGVYPYGTYTGDIVFQDEVMRFKDIKSSRAAGHRDHPPGAGADPRALDHREHLPRQRAAVAPASSTGTRPTSRATELLARVGLADDPDTQIKNIGVGKQQLVEIAKALNKDVKLLILDEPTAALNEADSAAPARSDRRAEAARASRSIIISHKLNEIERDRRRDHDHPRRPADRDAQRQGRRRRRGPHHPRHGRSDARESLPRAHPEHRRGPPRGARLDRSAPADTRQARRARTRASQCVAGEIVGLRRPDGRRAHRAGDEHLRPLVRHVRVGRDVQGRPRDPRAHRVRRDRQRPRVRHARTARCSA